MSAYYAPASFSHLLGQSLPTKNTFPLSRANSGASDFGGLLPRATGGLDSVKLTSVGESEVANGSSLGSGLLPRSISWGAPLTSPVTPPSGDIPQGLPPSRLRAFAMRGRKWNGISGPAAGLGEGRDDFAAAQSVVSFSAVPPALQDAEPALGPALVNGAGTMDIQHAHNGIKGAAVGGELVGTLGGPATGLSTAAEMGISSQHPENSGTDEYEDDTDPGYHRQPIEDEEAFLANEIAVPADEEDGTSGRSRKKAEEDNFETFELRVIHRKKRTGFEDDKDFPIILDTVIAGRYHVKGFLGSAASSNAIQAHDSLTGMDVCLKIIKNQKDFFDQGLDEIKILKYLNKNDPADKHHVLRLYDYFYHREHLFIVCELLRENLFEYLNYNRSSGEEPYFTMARLQSITVQCLEALAYIHQLGLIHCDLKPENILGKSYSRCEIKVIDLGSSCFQTDQLTSYLQSRFYRAPEVILGLPCNEKIDIWSLGCILAELCTGDVLFQNHSLAMLLARVIGICGPIPPAMLAKGKDTHMYFTKSGMLYERNPESDRLEYLIPKKSSLRHRLPTGDPGFVEFVAYLLEINPEKRPTAKEALGHPWLKHPYEKSWLRD